MTWFKATRLFDGQRIHQNVLLQVDEGYITHIKHNADSDEQGYDHIFEGLISPGFVDTQVNGGGGKLLNHDPSFETVELMSQAHLQFGTTSLTPTLITDNLTVMQKAADAVAEALARLSKSVVGIHFEGPILSVAKRGIHPQEQVRSISDAELKLLLRKDLGTIVTTLAPEQVSTDVIKELVANGVIVSLGHSNASADQALAAIEAGASGATHLYNAMSGLKARDPGLIGAVLNSPSVTAGLIVDIHHVHPLNCQLAFSAKTSSGVMLVTDSMAHVGTDIKQLPWLDASITRDKDKLTMPDGTLAGSCLDMITAVKNTVHKVGISKTEALEAASKTPARFLQRASIGEIKVGALANFVELDEDLNITSVWQQGERV